MAKRNDMSAARRSRNREQEDARSRTEAVTLRGAEATRDSLPLDERDGLSEVMRRERRRLMQAQAILRCAAFALLYEDWLEDSGRPSFSDVVAAVHDLVTETIERLAPS